MPDAGQYELPFDNQDLNQLQWLFAEEFTDPRTLRTLVDECGLPPQEVDPDGEMSDRWAQVVRACYDQKLLGFLIEVADRRLAAKGRDKLTQIIESVRQRQIDTDGKKAVEAVERVRQGLERLWDLEDPAQCLQIARDIRSEVMALRRLIERDRTIPYVIVSVGVVAEPSLATREKTIRACEDVISSVDRLLGVIQLADDSLDGDESLPEGSRDPILRQTSLLDAKITARLRLAGNIRRFLRIIAQDAVLVSPPSMRKTPRG
jgi:hypothetical protein